MSTKAHFCAWENQDCYCDAGNIYYGANHNGKVQLNRGWTAMDADEKAQKNANGKFTKCNNGNFGDPLHGVRKACFCETSSYVEHKPFKFNAEYPHPYYQLQASKVGVVKETP